MRGKSVLSQKGLYELNYEEIIGSPCFGGCICRRGFWHSGSHYPGASQETGAAGSAENGSRSGGFGGR